MATIRAVRITPPSEKRGKRSIGKASAELLVDTPDPKNRLAPDTRTAATVQAGDVLLVGEVGYKVRNVVPKDDKTKAVGWVEFAPDRIKRADLERDKVPYVVPKPVPTSGPKDK